VLSCDRSVSPCVPCFLLLHVGTNPGASSVPAYNVCTTPFSYSVLLSVTRDTLGIEVVQMMNRSRRELQVGIMAKYGENRHVQARVSVGV
jgi:hypothetical protein